METYRVSSRIRERNHEYLIQTANVVGTDSVSTTVHVDGIKAEQLNFPHPAQFEPEQVLAMVKASHNDKRHELESMLKAYDEVVSTNKPTLIHQLGTAFLYRGFYTEASELFKIVLRHDSKHHQALIHLSRAYIEIGQEQLAIDTATKAVGLRSGYADYRNALGEAYLQNEEIELATKEFDQALKINLYYAEAYFNRGLTYIIDGISSQQIESSRTVELALDCLGKAEMIAIEYRKSTDFEEGLEALRSGELEHALRMLRTVRDTQRASHRQEFASLYLRFVLSPELVSEKALGDRIIFLEEQIKKNPGYVDLQAELAFCYLEQSQINWKKGVEQLKRAKMINPSLTKISNQLEEVEIGDKVINRIISNLSEQM